jgi:hypothetical protein
MRAIFFLVLMAGTANAHDWYSDRRDPIYNLTKCCGGSDCNELPPGSMSFTSEGHLRVTLTLEQARRINPWRVEPFDEVIPPERLQTSEDGKAHICLLSAKMDERQGFFCIFIPPDT